MAQTAQLTIYIKIKLYHLTVLGFWGPQNPLKCFSSYYNYLFKMTNSLANTNTELVNIINGIKMDEEDIQRVIAKEEEEKHEIEQKIGVLNERLEEIKSSL